jgi:hypothetical protein
MNYRWVYGLSIYPVAYVFTVIHALIGGKSNFLQPPVSILYWLNKVFFDSINLLNTPITGILFIAALVVFNTVTFVLLASLLIRVFKQEVVIIILYVLLIVLNCLIPDVSL